MYWSERNALTKYNKILITDHISYGKFYTCRPQNVHIAGITLSPTAVAAVWHVRCYQTLTPYTATHLLCPDNAASLQIIYNHISVCNVLI